MDNALQELELVDLGDAKEATKGIYTLEVEEDSGGMIYRATS